VKTGISGTHKVFCVIIFCVLLFPLASSAQAQQPAKVARIGVLAGGGMRRMLGLESNHYYKA